MPPEESVFCNVLREQAALHEPEISLQMCIAWSVSFQ